MRVVCLGELVVDFISPDRGTLSDASCFHRCLGGAAANVAVGIGQRGARVSLVSKVGADEFGRYARLEASNQGLSTEYVYLDDARPTRCTFIAHDADGRRHIEIANRSSADQALQAAEITPALEDVVHILYLSGVALLNARLAADVMEAVDRVRRLSGWVAFDPVVDVSRVSEVIKERIASVVGHTDILIASHRMHDGLYARADPAIRILTYGEEGARIRSGRLDIDIPARKVRAVDPTGAGDAFLASFLASMVEDRTRYEGLHAIEEPLLRRWGERSADDAARIVQAIGAVTAYRR